MSDETTRGAAQRSVEGSIRYTIALSTPIWWVSLAVSPIPGLDRSGLAVWLVCLVANGIAIAAFGVSRRSATLLGVTTAATATIISCLAAANPIPDAYPEFDRWISLGVIVSAVLVPGRPVIVAISAALLAPALAFVVTQNAAGLPADTATGVGVVALVLVEAIGFATAATELRSAARKSDEGAADLAAAQAETLSASVRAQETRRVTRLLHDTVINTLFAVRSMTHLDPERVRQRCAEDLARIRDPGSPALRTAGQIDDQVIRRATLSGVTAVSAGNLPADLRPQLAEALEGMLIEAINNVARHTQTKTAQILWTPTSVSVSDTGAGFELADLTGGSRHSILERAQEAGIAVATQPRGEGSRIEFTWEGPPLADPRNGEVPLVSLMASVTSRVTVTLLLAGVLGSIVQPGRQSGAGDWAPEIIAAGVVVWSFALWRGRGPDRIPWPLYPLLIVVAVLLPGFLSEGCLRGPIWWWGSVGGISVVLAAVLIDGRRPAVVAAIAGYLSATFYVLVGSLDGGPACARANLRMFIIDIGVMFAVVQFRRVLAQAWTRAATEHSEAARIRMAQTEKQLREQTQQQLSQRALQICAHLLSGIAEGRLDPADPDVRRQCALAETTLRSLTAIPASLGSLGETLSHVVSECGHNGRRVEITADEGFDPGQGWSQRVGADMVRLAESMLPGGVLRITVIAPGDRLLVLANCTQKGPAPEVTDFEFVVDGDSCLFRAEVVKPA